MHVTSVAAVSGDPASLAAADLVAAILGPALVVAQADDAPEVVTVGPAATRPRVVVRVPTQPQQLAFFSGVPRLRDGLASVDVAHVVEACVEICRGRSVVRKAKEADVRARIDEHLRANNVCGFTSGPASGFRAIPIEYDWDGETLAFMSEGGEKFARMALQPEVSVTVADRYTGFATLRGTQITGEARLLDEGDPRVATTLASKGLTRGRIASLPCRMHFFQVVPTRIEHLDAVAAKAGSYDALQVVGRLEPG
ncbi:MAG: hypothetical protein HOO96_13550 [Polyangiaceae bacterium]|nr:hypothetical protein [Polyangiaceae bacterium]